MNLQADEHWESIAPPGPRESVHALQQPEITQPDMMSAWLCPNSFVGMMSSGYSAYFLLCCKIGMGPKKKKIVLYIWRDTLRGYFFVRIVCSFYKSVIG